MLPEEASTMPDRYAGATQCLISARRRAFLRGISNVARRGWVESQRRYAAARLRETESRSRIGLRIAPRRPLVLRARELRRPSCEQVEPTLRDPKPALAVFFCDGSVGPFLRVFGVLEVLFFAAHVTPRQAFAWGEHRGGLVVPLQSKKSPANCGGAAWELRASGGWIAPSGASTPAIEVGSKRSACTELASLCCGVALPKLRS
jgi:hypothetical protein